MKTLRTILLNVLAALALAGTANADVQNGYLTGSSGNIVKGAFNTCWHSGFWTPAMANEECDPAYVKKAEPVVAAVAAPAPVAAVVVEKKPAFASYTVQAEALFDYNKSDIRETGKQRLKNEIVDKVKDSTRDNVLLITGYADRIGSPEYNLKLSQRRADAVKAFLVEQGVDGSRIETSARGEADPIVSCSNVKGKANRKNKALIACLQPNRRIVLELKGQVQEQK